MPLKTEYTDAVLTELLIEKLKDGTIPTLESIISEYDTLVLNEPLLGEKPLFSLEDNSVQFYENSSVAKTNSSFDRFSKDVSIIWESINETEQNIIKSSRRWSSYYESTKRLLDKIEDRIDNLLLLNSDTLGYFQYVSDDFTTTEFSDLENTTALIDTGNGFVQIKQETSASVEGAIARINLSELIEDDFTFEVVSSTGLNDATLATGSLYSNSIQDEYISWLSYVRVSQQLPVTVSLAINLKETKSVNKIDFTCNGATLTSAFTVTLMYSKDGIDYVLVPTEAHTQSTLDVATWSFPTIDFQYVKFLITKSGADDKDSLIYIYEFGAKNIKLYEASFDVTTGHEFFSTSRSVQNTDGETLSFQKISLSTCEDVPPNTSINYFVSVDESNYLVIDPIERNDPSRPHVVDFSEAVVLNNLDSSSVNNDSFDSDLLNSDLDTYNDFILTNDETDLLLNWYIPSEDTNSVKEENIVVWRNVGNKSRAVETVRNVNPGWNFNSTTNIYSTIVRIEADSGLIINLGTSQMTIDGTVQTGVVTLNQGNHTIQTASINWLSIETDITDLATLKAIDLLYPYNHKLLIEGYQYDSTYVDERIYQGVSLFAENITIYITLHDFNTLTSTNNVSVYTRDVDNNGNLVFVFKTDKDFSDFQNERFLVEYNLTNFTFSNIILKAVLNTTDSSVTPTFTSYIIKLG